MSVKAVELELRFRANVFAVFVLSLLKAPHIAEISEEGSLHEAVEREAVLRAALQQQLAGLFGEVVAHGHPVVVDAGGGKAAGAQAAGLPGAQAGGATRKKGFVVRYYVLVSSGECIRGSRQCVDNAPVQAPHKVRLGREAVVAPVIGAESREIVHVEARSGKQGVLVQAARHAPDFGKEPQVGSVAGLVEIVGIVERSEAEAGLQQAHKRAEERGAVVHAQFSEPLRKSGAYGGRIHQREHHGRENVLVEERGLPEIIIGKLEVGAGVLRPLHVGFGQ